MTMKEEFNAHGVFTTTIGKRQTIDENLESTVYGTLQQLIGGMKSIQCTPTSQSSTDSWSLTFDPQRQIIDGTLFDYSTIRNNVSQISLHKSSDIYEIIGGVTYAHKETNSEIAKLLHECRELVNQFHKKINDNFEVMDKGKMRLAERRIAIDQSKINLISALDDFTPLINLVESQIRLICELIFKQKIYPSSRLSLSASGFKSSVISYTDYMQPSAYAIFSMLPGLGPSPEVKAAESLISWGVIDSDKASMSDVVTTSQNISMFVGDSRSLDNNSYIMLSNNIDKDMSASAICSSSAQHSPINNASKTGPCVAIGAGSSSLDGCFLQVSSSGVEAIAPELNLVTSSLENPNYYCYMHLDNASSVFGVCKNDSASPLLSGVKVDGHTSGTGGFSSSSVELFVDNNVALGVYKNNIKMRAKKIYHNEDLVVTRGSDPIQLDKMYQSGLYKKISAVAIQHSKTISEIKEQIRQKSQLLVMDISNTNHAQPTSSSN